jgi:uncharacterized membrane protein YjdF
MMQMLMRIMKILLVILSYSALTVFLLHTPTLYYIIHLWLIMETRAYAYEYAISPGDDAAYEDNCNNR